MSGESVRFANATPQELVAATARLVDEALGLLEHAKKADDRRTALSALKEARDGLALLMRIAGHVSTGSRFDDGGRLHPAAVVSLKPSTLQSNTRGVRAIYCFVQEPFPDMALPFSVQVLLEVMVEPLRVYVSFSCVGSGG